MAYSHVSYAPGASMGRARVSFTSQIVAMVKSVYRRLANRRAVTRLVHLDDRMLADIGLTYEDVRRAQAAPYWDDPTAMLAGAVSKHRRH